MIVTSRSSSAGGSEGHRVMYSVSDTYPHQIYFGNFTRWAVRIYLFPRAKHENNINNNNKQHFLEVDITTIT